MTDTEFSKTVLVQNGVSVADKVHELVGEFMESVKNSLPIEYTLSIDIELAKDNPDFVEKFGKDRYVACVSFRCTVYRFHVKEEFK